MRHPDDLHTLDLPGVETLPAFKRGTVAERKKIMLYSAPKVRPHCAICAHCELGNTPQGYDALTCMLGGFAVQRGSVCQLYQLHDDPTAR
jgi:hypothetical protein